MKMFKFLFDDSKKKLEKMHAKLLEEAMNAQRSGNIALYAKLSMDAEKIYKKIIQLKDQ
jgi:hypothetical protein